MPNPLVRARCDQHSSDDTLPRMIHNEKKDFKIRAREIGRSVYVHSQVN